MQPQMGLAPRNYYENLFRVPLLNLADNVNHNGSKEPICAGNTENIFDDDLPFFDDVNLDDFLAEHDNEDEDFRLDPSAMGNCENDNHGDHTKSAQVMHPRLACNGKHEDDECPPPRKRRRLHQSRSKMNHAVFPAYQRVQSTQAAHVFESLYAQFVDCKTKKVLTASRHENLGSNIKSHVLHAEMKWYRLLQIVICKNGRRLLQTPCLSLIHI